MSWEHFGQEPEIPLGKKVTECQLLQFVLDPWVSGMIDHCTCKDRNHTFALAEAQKSLWAKGSATYKIRGRDNIWAEQYLGRKHIWDGRALEAEGYSKAKEYLGAGEFSGAEEYLRRKRI